LEIKTNEIKLLKITTEKQLQFTRRGNSGKTDFTFLVLKQGETPDLVAKRFWVQNKHKYI